MYEPYYNALLNFLRQRLPSGDIATDLTQETYVRVLAARQDADIANPRAFLFRTARNLCVDYYRSSDKQNINDMVDIHEHEHPGPAEFHPDSQLYREQRLQQLSSAVASLPERCREIFILHKVEGYSHAEIAKRLGISRDAVEKQMIKAMLRLCQQLGTSEVQDVE